MKRQDRATLLFGLCIILVMTLAASNPLNTGQSNKGNGWYVVATDADIDGTAEPITGLATTFAQLSAAATVYVQAGGPATNTVLVSGVSSDDKYISEEITVAGATPVTSTNTFKYVDQFWALSEVAVAVALYGTATDTLINEIPIGTLKADVAQHFNPEKPTYVKKWWATTNAATVGKALELRFYPDDADCLDPTDGFMLLDRFVMAAGIYDSGMRRIGNESNGLRLPAGGWLTVYGTGEAANQEATVTVTGEDRRQ